MERTRWGRLFYAVGGAIRFGQAISLGVQGIIVSHGQPEALKDVVQKGLDAGIKVVAKDIDLGNPKVPLISQRTKFRI